jgi:hypothetical protein
MTALLKRCLNFVIKENTKGRFVQTQVLTSTGKPITFVEWSALIQ